MNSGALAPGAPAMTTLDPVSGLARTVFHLAVSLGAFDTAVTIHDRCTAVRRGLVNPAPFAPLDADRVLPNRHFLLPIAVGVPGAVASIWQLRVPARRATAGITLGMNTFTVLGSLYCANGAATATISDMRRGALRVRALQNQQSVM